MLPHFRYSPQQIQVFDKAWRSFMVASILVFSLIIAAPTIKTALYTTSSAWLAVPAYLCGSGAVFLLFCLALSSIRDQAYLSWYVGMLRHEWSFDIRTVIEERLVYREMKKAFSADLQQIEALKPRLGLRQVDTIDRFVNHPAGMDGLRTRDVRYLGRFMRHHGLTSHLENLGSRANHEDRQAYIEKVASRRDWEAAEKTAWEGWGPAGHEQDCDDGSVQQPGYPRG